MGGIDVVLYLSGGSPLVRVAEAPAALWHEMLATNLVGAAADRGRRPRAPAARRRTPSSW